MTARGLAHGETRFAGNPFALSYSSMARALVHLADGELPEALARARAALELAERSRGPLEQGAAHRVLGISTRPGKRDEAEEAYRRSREILEEIQSLPELGQTLLAYGRFQRADNPDEGRRLIEQARVQSSRRSTPPAGRPRRTRPSATAEVETRGHHRVAERVQRASATAS